MFGETWTTLWSEPATRHCVHVMFGETWTILWSEPATRHTVFMSCLVKHGQYYGQSQQHDTVCSCHVW
jgi:hypothetical protein